MGDTFYAQLASAIELEAARNKYALIVCSSEGDGDKEFELIRTLKAKQVDGIIIAPTKVSKKGIDLLSEETFPYVLVDRYYPNLASNYVIVNNTQSCYDVVHYLGKKGARKIALLTTDIHLYVMKQRVEGYRKALQDLGLDSDLSWNFSSSGRIIRRTLLISWIVCFRKCRMLMAFSFRPIIWL